ncbi:WD40 repeat-like protein [Phanerochaete sordida]|uniref:WD40 repeat-like protein n=1 Tax=Phanerochaete sordida TaxID=48140 RepID=A0A9P3L9I4_9APHY|nr:WD40 repeat-like protein [Phanerochaete sordida]
MSPEPIVIPSDDEIECVGQYRRAPVQHPPAVVDLTGDDDDDDNSNMVQLRTGPTVAGPSRQRSTSGRSPGRDRVSTLSRTVENGRRIVTEKALQAASRGRSQPVQVESIEISDDEEEDFHGLGLDQTFGWKQGTRPTSRETRDLEDSADVSESTRKIVQALPVTQRRKEKAALTSILPRYCSAPAESDELARSLKGLGIWAKLAALQPMSSTVVPSTAHRKSRIWRIQPNAAETMLRRTRRESLGRFSSGSVNAIVQSGPLTVVASCAAAGDANDDPENMAYNLEGSLKILCNGQEPEGSVLNEHKKVLDLGGTSLTKTYTVNDVQFDPADSTRFVSCAKDGRLVLWNCDVPEKPVKHRAMHYRDSLPEGLQYKPSGSLLAVWTDDGMCILHNNLEGHALKLRAGKKVPVQSVVWGRGAFSNKLYTTAGSDETSTGQHKCFDVTTDHKGLLFGGDVAGECLDVDPTGTWLAHATCSEHTTFKLALYDTNNLRRPARELCLSEFDSESKPRIQQVLFSPDSVHLAVARSDNVTHVYDARFLSRRLYDLPHGAAVEATKADGEGGIYKVEWLENGVHGLSLVSCGADGCVRLWDMKRAGGDFGDTIIASSTSYAGWFSLGDVYKGETPLILGDGGEASLPDAGTGRKLNMKAR